MSIDRSLKVKGALTRHRNVLTRAERIEKLKDAALDFPRKPLVAIFQCENDF